MLSGVRLGVFLLGVGLLITRLSLVFHEVVGHALPAALFGAQVDAVRLFSFAGGYVRWSGAEFSPAERLVVSLGGIAGELALAAALAVVATRPRMPPLVRALAAVAAALDALHALFYLSVGVADGFGDGRALHERLGVRRGWLAWPAAALLIAGGGLFSRELMRTLGAWTRGPWRAARVCGALAIAAGGHFALMQAELALRGDHFFADRRAEAADRRAELAIAEKRREAEARGEAPDARAEAAWAAEVAARPPPRFSCTCCRRSSPRCSRVRWRGPARRRARSRPPPRASGAARGRR